MNTIKKVTTFCALALAASGAQAAVISGGSFMNAEETTEINQSGVLNLFDSLLGTLVSATLTLEGYATSSISLTNNAAQNQSVSATGSVALFFTESGIADLGIADPAMTLNLDYTSGFVNLLSGETQVFGPVTDDQQVVIFKAADASVFATPGGGQFQIGCTSISGLNVLGGGGHVDADQDTTAGCGASIEYEFEEQVELPSPTPRALLAGGLIGIAAVRRFARPRF